MAKWRPEEWSNPYPKTIVDECSGIEVNSGKYPIFEAGADAMLKALRKRGKHITGHGVKTVGDPSGYHYEEDPSTGFGCTEVFIPDEEVSSFPLICGSCHTRHSPEEACPPRRKL